MIDKEASYDRIRRRVLAGLGLIVLEGSSSADSAGISEPDGLDRTATTGSGVSRERSAFDLIRFWFDEIWAPGLRYMDGFKGDRDAALETTFREAFSEEEYLWLERFNRFLELRVDRLAEEDREDGRFPSGDTWSAIVRDARNLLELLDPDVRLRLSEKKLLQAFRERRT